MLFAFMWLFLMQRVKDNSSEFKLSTASCLILGLKKGGLLERGGGLNRAFTVTDLLKTGEYYFPLFTVVSLHA